MLNVAGKTLRPFKTSYIKLKLHDYPQTHDNAETHVDTRRQQAGKSTAYTGPATTRERAPRMPSKGAGALTHAQNAGDPDYWAPSMRSENGWAHAVNNWAPAHAHATVQGACTLWRVTLSREPSGHCEPGSILWQSGTGAATPNPNSAGWFSAKNQQINVSLYYISTRKTTCILPFSPP